MEKTVKNLAWLMAITCLMACGCSGHKGASVSNGSDTALQAGKALRSSATSPWPTKTAVRRWTSCAGLSST